MRRLYVLTAVSNVEINWAHLSVLILSEIGVVLLTPDSLFPLWVGVYVVVKVFQ